eukprot:677989-Pelagomonas_calceolata.AAC.1
MQTEGLQTEGVSVQTEGGEANAESPVHGQRGSHGPRQHSRAGAGTQSEHSEEHRGPAGNARRSGGPSSMQGEAGSAGEVQGHAGWQPGGAKRVRTEEQ